MTEHRHPVAPSDIEERQLEDDQAAEHERWMQADGRLTASKHDLPCVGTTTEAIFGPPPFPSALIEQPTPEFVARLLRKVADDGVLGPNAGLAVAARSLAWRIDQEFPPNREPKP
jgi:hypothetical protein